MSQVTLYLDDAAEKILNRFSKKNRLSKSKWLSSLIQKETASEWPEKLLKLAGKWTDFPSLKQIRSGQGKDIPREEF